jgi:hypothetical protein
MKVLRVARSREEYLATQIARSEAKFSYCKVSVADVARYRAIIEADDGRRMQPRTSIGPIICLGTRNGREVDLFRIGFFRSAFHRGLVRVLERNRRSLGSRLPATEAMRRSKVDGIEPSSVIGVEINPRGRRRDVWVGSFDAMPGAWASQFGVLFSNAFDQSEDPERTAREWVRVARDGAYVIICFDEEAEPTATDPVGRITVADVLRLFAGRLLYFRRRGSRAGYSEAIIRLNASAS